MNTDATYNPQVQNDSEESRPLNPSGKRRGKSLYKKILAAHFKKLNAMIAEAVLSQKKSLQA